MAVDKGDDDGVSPPKTKTTTTTMAMVEAPFNLDDFDFDPDDPNYKHTNMEMMRNIQKLYMELPEGWQKREYDGTKGGGGAPFVHVDGRKSWKHPNHEKMRKVHIEAEKEVLLSSVPTSSSDDDNNNNNSPSKALIKKYRMMIKNGIPVGAVKQTAIRDGVDPVIIDKITTDDTFSSEPTKAEIIANHKSESALLDKYRRMLRSGVPIGAVEQTAKREGVDPSVLIDQISHQNNEGTVAAAAAHGETKKALLKKYRVMIKSGIAPDAVKQRAIRDGVDPAIIDEIVTDVTSSSSGPTDGSDVSAVGSADVLNRFKVMIKNGASVEKAKQTARLQGIDQAIIDQIGNQNDDGTAAHDESKKEDANDDDDMIFKPCGNDQVKFIADQNKKGSHLASLVRKMVQTVKKYAGEVPNVSTNGLFITVENKDLYDALGSFRGVKFARDVYNSTCTCNDKKKHEMSESEVRSKRKAFLEHLSSLGIRPPTRKNDPADIEGLDDLIAFIENKYDKELKQVSDNFQVGTYDFESLSEIYKPGSKIVAKNAFTSGVDMLCEVSWARYEQGRTLAGISRYFKVCFQFVVAVGDKFTFSETVEGIENFDGRRNLLSLQFVPLFAYSDEVRDKMVSTFRKRGEMYSRCATGANFLEYDKGSFHAKGGRGGRESQTVALRTHGKVMVDTQGSYEAGHSLSIGYDPMITGIKYKYKEYMLHKRALKQKSGSAAAVMDSSTTSSSGDDGMVLFDIVPSDYLEMTWPAAVGFSFTSKVWGDVLIDGLRDIQFQDTAFDNLVLPASRKRMVKALVRHSNDAFHDIISGKGEGSVFLLYGPPGVGKTLTAEAISEMLGRPLYSVSVGQLGTTPAELETKLGEILDLCARWDALILLDEADIFLEKRSAAGSLERNAMVSVMLRLVEYFKGVLFLTSNRVASLDPAFKTRITLALQYDPLDKEARSQVWNNLLTASGFEESIKAGIIDPTKLAGHELNGREIKNAIRLAMALSKEDEKPLSQDLILETVDILCNFNEEMDSAEAY